MKPKYKYDYYYVTIPDDLGTLQEQGDQAIREAEERSRLYVMPCSWTAERTRRRGFDGHVWKVVRKRNNS